MTDHHGGPLCLVARNIAAIKDLFPEALRRQKDEIWFASTIGPVVQCVEVEGLAEGGRDVVEGT